jgi:hypothetical protein
MVVQTKPLPLPSESIALPYSLILSLDTKQSELLTMMNNIKILSRVWVTIDRFWIADWIYCPFTDRNYNLHNLQITEAHYKSFKSAVSAVLFFPGNGF